MRGIKMPTRYRILKTTGEEPEDTYYTIQKKEENIIKTYGIFGIWKTVHIQGTWEDVVEDCCDYKFPYQNIVYIPEYKSISDAVVALIKLNLC